jgi:hypothetical protein
MGSCRNTRPLAAPRPPRSPKRLRHKRGRGVTCILCPSESASCALRTVRPLSCHVATHITHTISARASHANSNTSRANGNAFCGVAANCNAAATVRQPHHRLTRNQILIAISRSRSSHAPRTTTTTSGAARTVRGLSAKSWRATPPPHINQSLARLCERDIIFESVAPSSLRMRRRRRLRSTRRAVSPPPVWDEVRNSQEFAFLRRSRSRALVSPSRLPAVASACRVVYLLSRIDARRAK